MNKNILIKDFFEEITENWCLENKILFLIKGTEKLFQEKRLSEKQIKQLKKVHKKLWKILQ